MLLVVGEGGAAYWIRRKWPPLGGTPLRGARPPRWRRGRGRRRVVAGRAHVAMARRGAQAGADSGELCQGRAPLAPAWSRRRRCARAGAHRRRGSVHLPSSPPLPFLHGHMGGGHVSGVGSAATGRADASERERENGERGERGRVGAIIEGQHLSTVHFSHF